MKSFEPLSKVWSPKYECDNSICENVFRTQCTQYSPILSWLCVLYPPMNMIHPPQDQCARCPSSAQQVTWGRKGRRRGEYGSVKGEGGTFSLSCQRGAPGTLTYWGEWVSYCWRQYVSSSIYIHTSHRFHNSSPCYIIMHVWSTNSTYLIYLLSTIYPYLVATSKLQHFLNT